MDSDDYGEDVRFFNTAGPCVPERHYMLPAEPRLPGARERIEEEGLYFVVHAPRQTGKTTTIEALARGLTATGEYAALTVSCEQAGAVGEEIGAASAELLNEMRNAAEYQLPAALRPPTEWPDGPPGGRIFNALRSWAIACPLPLVLFLDEIDSMRGQALVSLLRQLRNGYRYRADEFPASVALCGMRDVRDYKAASGGNPDRMGSASPFNVAESIRISDFTSGQVAELYAQHTADTGQEFTPEAVALAFDYTQGQPWLVNALAREITRKLKVPLTEAITAGHIDQARQRLILARQTHLDSLAARLVEPRVRSIIEPLIAGTLPDGGGGSYNDDLAYVRDLGLIAERGPVRPANPIYKEVIIRVLTEGFESTVTAEPRSFLLPDGRLDFGKLLTDFAEWWRRNGEWLAKGEFFHEVAPQLIFMAFLQRVVNGGGMVDREYAMGTGRVDILVRKPYTGADGEPAIQEEAVELKVRSDKSGDPLPEGMEQIDRYLCRIGLDHGTLLIFDRRADVVRDLPAPRFTKARSPEGRDITVLTA